MSSFDDALSLVSSWPVTSAAVAVVGPDGVLAHTGPTDVAFAWASVTKVLTASAVLIAADEGALDLDEAAGPPESTVRHLLAHASGLPFDGATPIAPPGHRRIYSNEGIEVVARHLESRTEIPFPEYLREGVLQPLGITGITLVASPAWGASGTILELARLAQELLRPQLIASSRADDARSVQFPGLRGVLPGFGVQDPNDWGLGAEIRGTKSPHWTGAQNSPATFGHFGRSGSFVWVDPVADIALVGVSADEFEEWSKTAWPALSDRVLAAV